MRKATFNKSIVLSDDRHGICALTDKDENTFEEVESRVGQDVIVIESLGKQIIPDGDMVFCYIEEFECGTWVLEGFIDYKD